MRSNVVSCGLTFELTGPWRQTPTGRGRTISNMAWSGQAVAAGAGLVVERGVRPHWAAQLRGERVARPYARNAIRKASALLKMMGAISRYLMCTPTKTSVSAARAAAARIVSCGCQ